MKSKVVEKLASLALLALAVLVSASVVSRYLFNWPIPDTLDFSRILLGITVLWGIALVIIQESHIQVDLLWSHVGPRVRKILAVFSRCLMLIVAVLFAYLVAEHVWQLTLSGKQTVDYRLLLWPFYLVFLPAGIIAVIASFKQLRDELRREYADD